MKILLINPPNCGRSIPEERYGIDSLKQIFRGEPLALEVLAGNLEGHEVRILDLKAEPEGLQEALARFRPDLVGITGVTCEANTMIRIAEAAAETCGATVAVGGIHASCDPSFFNRPEIDFVVTGLGKASFAELAAALERGEKEPSIPGIARTDPGRGLRLAPRGYGLAELAEEKPPRYDLTAGYRDSYTISSLGLRLGFVVSAFGCPSSCSFCCIGAATGNRYLTHATETVLRDIRLLQDLPVIRLVDANTFGDIRHARALADGIVAAGIRKAFIADVRSDTVVRHPELLERWKEAGLRSVVIGFEEINDSDLRAMNKESTAALNREAVAILHGLGITVVGDFIVSPDYDGGRFDLLERYLEEARIDLPILTVLTPLPGTPLHLRMKERITVHDLDYYTLTNAVMPTSMGERAFYERYAALVKSTHAGARL